MIRFVKSPLARASALQPYAPHPPGRARTAWLVAGCIFVLAALPAALPSVAAAQSSESASPADRRRGQLLWRAQQRTRSVMRLLAQARLSGTRRQVLCVDHTLSQVHRAYRVMSERAARARDARQRGDRRSARREDGAIAILEARSRELVQQALVCVGAPTRRGGRAGRGTTVTVQIAHDLREPLAIVPPSVSPRGMPTGGRVGSM